ncbi:MAG: universal stress protein [Planctomycetes bacterium]|nr:universal stress protein [Planctomycetota bacterium]
MIRIKNILVPTDFSSLSDKALSHAIDIAQKYGARVYVIHVVDVIQQCSVDYCIDVDIMQRLEREAISHAKESIQKQLNKLSMPKGLEIEPDVKQGTAYLTILKEQDEMKIDLIVVGAHKKKRFINYFLGSVADKIIRGASCPVLVVKS